MAFTAPSMPLLHAEKVPPQGAVVAGHRSMMVVPGAGSSPTQAATAVRNMNIAERRLITAASTPPPEVSMVILFPEASRTPKQVCARELAIRLCLLLTRGNEGTT